MKRLIKATTAMNVDRITIDFYGGIDLTEIEAVSNPKRVFKNTQVVMRDVKAYLVGKGLTILRVEKSTNADSDSTYYDVDVKLRNKKGDIRYLYFRISDHDEDPINDVPRKNYHDRITRNYEGLSDQDNVDNLYRYNSIAVTSKRHDNYDRAMNKVKSEIDRILNEEGIE